MGLYKSEVSTSLVSTSLKDVANGRTPNVIANIKSKNLNVFFIKLNPDYRVSFFLSFLFEIPDEKWHDNCQRKKKHNNFRNLFFVARVNRIKGAWASDCVVVCLDPA